MVYILYSIYSGIGDGMIMIYISWHLLTRLILPYFYLSILLWYGVYDGIWYTYIYFIYTGILEYIYHYSIYSGIGDYIYFACSKFKMRRIYCHSTSAVYIVAYW